MTLSESDITAIASELIDARRSKHPKVTAARLAGIDVADAYRIQDAVARRLGPVEGWKVGAPSPDAEPACAPIMRGGVIAASAAPIGVPNPAGIEVEVVFRMGRAMPPSRNVPSEDDIFANIKSAHVGLELCSSRLDTGADAPGNAKLADNGINHAFVVGGPIKNWREIEASQQQARIIIDGKLVAESSGGHSHGDVGALLVWLVRHVVAERGGLPAGALIATGSWTPLMWVNTPAIVGGALEGLGRLDVILREADPVPRVGAPPGRAQV